MLGPLAFQSLHTKAKFYKLNQFFLNEEILRMISTREYVREVIQLLFQISCFASGI